LTVRRGAGNVLDKGIREALDVVTIEVGGGLVQGEDATVEAEGLCQRKADYKRSQDFLSSTAPAAHVQLGVALYHDHLHDVANQRSRSI
jgi:hypothetical protein